MASFYFRSKSRHLWIKWYDENGDPHFESTNRFKRPNGEITPCPKNKEGERLARTICEEIEAAKKLKITKSFFIPLSEKSTSIQEAFDQFKKINKNKSASTIKEHNYFYKVLTQNFPAEQPCDILTKISTEEWLADLPELTPLRKKGKYSQNTRFSFQKNLKKFLNFCFERELIAKPFILSKDVLVRPEVREKIIFNDEHIHLIMEGLKNKNSNFRTCIYLLLYTGLRPSDILTILAEKIDLRNKSMEYYSPKAKKYISVPIDRRLIPVLKERIKIIPQGLLLDYANHHSVRRAFTRYLREDLKLKNIRYTPRTFRKSYDTWAYRYGMDIVANSRLVGHSVSTAEKNYREVALEKLRIEQKKFRLPPRPKSKKLVTPSQ